MRHHHERWDGDGYPDGLEGEEIPMAARVFAVADTLDALTSDGPVPGRVIDMRDARGEITGGAGRQFDPASWTPSTGMPDEAFVRIREEIG